MLACVIGDPNIDLKDAEKYCDLVEYRFDLFSEFDLSQLKNLSHPAIFTHRNAPLSLLEKLAHFQPEYMDLEHGLPIYFYERIQKISPETKLIVSYHNYEEVPCLESLFEEMKKPFECIYKIACKANSSLDLLRMMRFLKESAWSLTVIAMGEYGEPSRVMGKVLGNAIDYTSLNGMGGLNQLTLKDLKDIYNYDALNEKTEFCGLMGDPINRSPGHIFHNNYFKEHDLNSVYLKFRVDKNEVREFFEGIKDLPFKGLSVTMPLKEELLCSKAINTVKLEDGEMTFSNTDGKGALDVLEKRESVKGKKVLIWGAGGSAKAIYEEALNRGADLTIINRTKSKAVAIAGKRGLGLHEMHGSYDIFINTTSVQDNYPIELLSSALIMDINHNPETKLLQDAQEMGCEVILGKEMFERQALLQQEVWSAGSRIYVNQ